VYAYLLFFSSPSASASQPLTRSTRSPTAISSSIYIEIYGVHVYIYMYWYILYVCLSSSYTLTPPLAPTAQARITLTWIYIYIDIYRHIDIYTYITLTPPVSVARVPQANRQLARLCLRPRFRHRALLVGLAPDDPLLALCGGPHLLFDPGGKYLASAVYLPMV